MSAFPPLLIAAGVLTAGLIAFQANSAHAQQRGWTTAVAPEPRADMPQRSAAVPESSWQTFSVGATPALSVPSAPAVRPRGPAPRAAITTGALPDKKAAPHAEAAPARAPVAKTSPADAPAPHAAEPAKSGAPVPAAHSVGPAPASAHDAAEGAESERTARAADNLRLAQKYCVNIVDAASDARFLLQKKSLTELQQQLDQRIEVLESRTIEYQKWLARRDEFSRKATENLVRIYAKMSPDSASAQMAAMDVETAAAILSKLDPRNASSILNEMPADKAAALTATIAGAAKVRAEQGAPQTAGANKS